MINKYEPIEDRCLIKILKDEVDTTDGVGTKGKTEGGILIAGNVQTSTIKAEVVAIGVGVYARESGVLIPTVLAPKDVVLIMPEGGYPVNIDPTDFLTEYRVIREGDIIMRVSSVAQNS